MLHAETVTFGGGGLERAAHLREDEARMAADLNDGKARVLALWRGRVLLDESADETRLMWLTQDHPVLAKASQLRLFLGLEGDDTRFAADISAWVPTGFDETQMAGLFDDSRQGHPALSETSVFAELRSVMTRLSPREAEIAATAKALLHWHATHGFCSRCGQPSQVAMAGWQRNCPSCGGQHFPRTDPVVIMLITHGNRVLLGRSPGWPEGMYSLLAGFIEPGETLEAAVRREVAEESGVEVGRVGYLSSQPWPYPSSLMFGAWGEALSEEIRIDPSEIEDALWLSREELAEAFAGRHPNVKPARKGSIAQFLLQNWLADRLD